MMKFLWAAAIGAIVTAYKNGSISADTAIVSGGLVIIAYLTIAIVSIESEIANLRTDVRLANERIDFLENNL